MLTRNNVELAIFAILAVILIYQVQRIHVLKADSLALQAQIIALQDESQAQAKRFDNARKEAEDAIKRSQKQADNIMLAQVPKDCEGAIKWGINEAHSFS